MQRIAGANYLANAFGAGKNGYQDYNPSTGQAGTTPTAAALDAIQEEIASFIEAQGLTLNANDNTQLAQAIHTYVASVLSPYETIAAATSALATALGTVETPAEVAAAISAALAAYAPLASPPLTGTPTINGTAIATTATAAAAYTTDGNGNWKITYPGGIVEMGGVISGALGAEAESSFAFPFGGFPNACFYCDTKVINSAASATGDTQLQEVTLTKTTFTYFLQDQAASFSDAGGGYRWHAKGN